MEKIKLTEDALAALGFQLSDIVMRHAVSDISLHDGHKLTDHIYHYCSLDTFEKIIHGQQLWATHNAHLNDQTEFKHGINVMTGIIEGVTDPDKRSILDALLKETKRLFEIQRYVTCFSRTGDLHSQWMRYGDAGEE
jgi:hypothetical protein